MSQATPNPQQHVLVGEFRARWIDVRDRARPYLLLDEPQDPILLAQLGDEVDELSRSVVMVCSRLQCNFWQSSNTDPILAAWGHP